MKDKFKIGIDYGGTKIEAILMNDKGDEIKRERSGYDRNYESGISTVKKFVETFKKESNNEATVGIAIPGYSSKETGLVHNANSIWLNNKHFKKDLISCNGLITNAGFQLPAEAIYLGKKILCKPLSGQPEQEHNAKILKKLQHATVCAEFTKEEIEMWIQNGKQKKELYNNSIDLMIEMIENPKKDFRSRISKLWI